MDRGTSKAADLNRRASMRNSVRVSVHGGEDEDYSFAAGAIADGFRPSASPPMLLEQLPSQSSSQSSTSSTLTVPTETSSSSAQHQIPSRPSSIAKPPRGFDSLALRHDGGFGTIQESGLSRESSVSSTSQTNIRPEDPYDGPSGPSHPYQIYPQNVRITRTSSVGTSSTAAPPAPDPMYTGPSGPAHPYGMYPQGTLGESSAMAGTAIPVGFPGLQSHYQRRVGPDGEEVADIIGPDGHTEQLPPYTRYPDEAYTRKVRAAEQQPITSRPATAPSSSSSSSAPAPIPGAGGIGMAARNPEFDDLESPQSRHSSRSFTSDASHHEINTAAAVVTEKQKRRTKWQIWARRRLWGIVPYWAILLTVIVILLMSIILGSVIGVLFSKRKKPYHRDDDADADTLPTMTMTYDATPIPTPTDLPELVTGSFSMPLMNTRISSTCFNNTQQAQAWNCNIIYAGLNMTIQKNKETPETNDYTVSMTCNDTFLVANHQYSYGMQPPIFPRPLPMELVNDTFKPNWGPAWFRMLPYTKTIVLPEAVLQPTQSVVSAKNMARDFQRYGTNDSGGHGSDFKRKGMANVGDRPWICTWPETFLELFIYPQQNSSWNGRNFGSPPPSSTVAGATITPAPTSAPAGGSPPAGTPNTSGPSGTQGSSVTQTTTSGGPSYTDGFDLPPLPYPRVIKLEERRIDRSPMPICRQVEISDDGAPARPVKDASGNDVVIYIVENEPEPIEKDQRKVSHKPGRDLSMLNNPLEQRDPTGPDLSDCGCMWFVT